MILGVNFAFALIHFLGSGMRGRGGDSCGRRKVTHSNFLVANFSDRTSSDLLVIVSRCATFLSYSFLVPCCFYWLQNIFNLEGKGSRQKK